MPEQDTKIVVYIIIWIIFRRDSTQITQMPSIIRHQRSIKYHAKTSYSLNHNYSSHAYNLDWFKPHPQWKRMGRHDPKQISFNG
jgi:hypothetical protein